jgi:hypothetical protein
MIQIVEICHYILFTLSIKGGLVGIMAPKNFVEIGPIA